MSNPPSGAAAPPRAIEARPAMTSPRSQRRRQAELDVDIGQPEIGVEQQDPAARLRASACARVMANQVLPTPPLPDAIAIRRAAGRMRRCRGPGSWQEPGPMPRREGRCQGRSLDRCKGRSLGRCRRRPGPMPRQGEGRCHGVGHGCAIRGCSSRSARKAGVSGTRPSAAPAPTPASVSASRPAAAAARMPPSRRARSRRVATN